ncbi:hypothetical protein D3C86_1924200 [compost metagenome]
MGQRADEHQVEQLRHHQGENGDFHRRANVLLGIEPRRQHLDHDDPEQAHRVGDQCPLGHQRIEGIELAILEQRDGQRLGQDPQCQGTRQHQHETQAQAPIENPRVFMAVLAGIGLGQGW